MTWLLIHWHIALWQHLSGRYTTAYCSLGAAYSHLPPHTEYEEKVSLPVSDVGLLLLAFQATMKVLMLLFVVLVQGPLHNQVMIVLFAKFIPLIRIFLWKLFNFRFPQFFAVLHSWNQKELHICWSRPYRNAAPTPILVLNMHRYYTTHRKWSSSWPIQGQFTTT
jgi:hypothetical protein